MATLEKVIDWMLVGRLRAVTGVAAALSDSGPLEAQLVISEVLASNHEIESDEFGVYSDWLELYNASDETLDPGGWF